MVSLLLRHCTIPIQLPTKQNASSEIQAGRQECQEELSALLGFSKKSYVKYRAHTLHCCRETWSCASSHPSLAAASLLDLLPLNLGPQRPLLIDICLVSVSHTFMWERRKIFKTFPLYYHLLTGLSENQHNLVHKKQSGEKFMKTDGGKAARVRPAMLGIGRIEKKDKTGVLIWPSQRDIF